MIGRTDILRVLRDDVEPRDKVFAFEIPKLPKSHVTSVLIQFLTVWHFVERMWLLSVCGTKTISAVCSTLLIQGTFVEA